MASAAEEQRETAPPGPQLWKISSVAVLGAFLAQMDATVVNVSLSSLALELHTSLSNIQWVTSGYLLALALTLPLSGWLVDRIGAKALYLWCFSLFTLTSALCGLAWSANSLIGFRILQGMSGGLLAPMAQLIMARAAGERMARVFGLAAMPILLAPLLGPVIAGAVLRFASWRWLFLVNLPFGVLALVLSAAFALPLQAQDRSNDQRDQPTQDHPAAPPADERRGPQADTRQGTADENRRAASDENHRAAPDEDRRAAPDNARRGGGDDVDALRHAHPRASARCPDGFFTTTRERARACTKHGGIDIWLEL